MNSRRHLTHGFTIIELVIVVVVISVLAAITFVSYGGVQDSARKAALMSDLDNAVSILELDLKQTGNYPTTVAGAGNGTGLSPSPGTTYQYAFNNTNTPKTFCLTATKGTLSYNINQEGVPSAGACPVLHLDAGIATSYPGSGTVLNDLSGKGKNAVLVNGVAYDSAKGGSWVFDGVNDTINLGTGNTFFPLPNFSMELWFKSDGTTPTTGVSPGLLGITYGVRLFVYTSTLSFGLDTGTAVTYLDTPSTYSFYNSSWHQVVIQATPTKREIYVDGSLANTKIDNWPGITQWPTNTANIGRDNNNVNYFFRGNIASIKIYDSNLSASEVNQNFNAARNRYGI
ncbi:LamG domain-containing protein [Candidatus Saccharibacteria bacterium]|nr:LamG domain-containing protein [Candidatus Saccharibacteria bacterium]